MIIICIQEVAARRLGETAARPGSAKARLDATSTVPVCRPIRDSSMPLRIPPTADADADADTARTAADAAAAVVAGTGAIDSTALLQGRRELLIRHDGELYRLRRTRNDKLILTK